MKNMALHYESLQFISNQSHSMFPLFPENRKFNPIVVVKCYPPDFKFHSCKLTNKYFPIWCIVKLSLHFILFIALKTDSNLTLHHIGKYFII